MMDKMWISYLSYEELGGLLKREIGMLEETEGDEVLSKLLAGIIQDLEDRRLLTPA